MNKFHHCIKNEEGSVIILSLLVLVILSIVGFSASRISTTEMQIVRNDATYQRNFYLAESGAVQAAQMLNNIDSSINRSMLGEHTPAWLNNGENLDSDGDEKLDDVGTWFATSGGSQTGAESNLSTLSDVPTIEYAAVDLGAAAGETLDINEPKIHNYAIIGIGNRNTRGQITVQIGYRKRY
jgi:type IV pilus assembly protein PilX